MSSRDELQSLEAEQQENLVKMQTEALALRFEVRLPSAAGSNQDWTATLLDVRGRLDRVEEILAKGIRARAAARRYHATVKHVVDDAWDKCAVAARRSVVGRGDEFSTGRERHASVNLEVMELSRDERTAKEFVEHCDEAVEVLRLAHRGLVDLRQDCLTVVRSAQFETTLDR